MLVSEFITTSTYILFSSSNRSGVDLRLLSMLWYNLQINIVALGRVHRHTRTTRTQSMIVNKQIAHLKWKSQLILRNEIYIIVNLIDFERSSNGCAAMQFEWENIFICPCTSTSLYGRERWYHRKTSSQQLYSAQHHSTSDRMPINEKLYDNFSLLCPPCVPVHSKYEHILWKETNYKNTHADTLTVVTYALTQLDAERT